MKKFKKLLAVMLSVMMVVCMVPAMGVSADEVLTINSVEDLIDFRDAVNAGNDYNKKTVVLAADLDLSGIAWEPIGYMGKTFKGTFDGGNHTIKNLSVVKELENTGANNSIGFFGRTDSPAVIKNLIVENATIKGSLYVGVIVGRGYTGKEIVNCTVKGDIAVDAWWYAGVIGGNGYMNKVANCHVIGNKGSYIKGNNGSYIGGIWGFRGEGGQTITNCSVTGMEIIGVDRVGGISGISHYGNEISNCSVSDCNIKATDSDATTVGLISGANQGTETSPAVFHDNTVSNTSATIGEKPTYDWTGTNIDGSEPSLSDDIGCYDHSTCDTLVYVEAEDATAVSEGTEAHYLCTACGAVFAAEDASDPLFPSEVVVPTLPAFTFIPSMVNFATTTGEFNEYAYFCREAREGDEVLLKVSLSDYADEKTAGLDYKKITVKYETEGAVQISENFDYNGNPLYKDGIATKFQLASGLNNIVAHVYYNGEYAGSFQSFYAYVD